MLKIKTFILIIIVYIIAFISIKSNINLFYPFYMLKDFIYIKTDAKEEIILDDNVLDGINMEIKNELDELKEINDLTSSLSDFTYEVASVVERNKMYWFNTITINKGKKDGLKEDMIVISNKGLIGKINKVGSNTSEIKLITTNDVNFKVSVMIKTNDDTIYGIMSGYEYNTNELLITSTNKSVDIEKNSLVYTSGMGGIYPSGILIGNVSNIVDDEYQVSKIIKVKPISDFNNLKFVIVLLQE